MKRILTHLGFMMAGNGPVVKIAVPSWRTDVHGKADIVEEIVRIVGVDKVPMTPFDRGDAPRKPILTADPVAHPPRQARAGRARHGRGRDLVVHRQTGRRTVRRRPERTGARQSDRGRSVRHAAEPAAGPDRSGAGQYRPRLSGCRAVRGRADLQGRQAGGSADRGIGRSPRLCVVKGHGTALVRLGDGRCVRRQGRCVRGIVGRRRADAGAADRARRRRAGCIRDVPAPSRSARKTCWAISASCIRARWKRSAPTGR